MVVQSSFIKGHSFPNGLYFKKSLIKFHIPVLYSIALGFIFIYSYVSVGKVCQECNKFNFDFNYRFKTENKEKYDFRLELISKQTTYNA